MTQPDDNVDPLVVERRTWGPSDLGALGRPESEPGDATTPNAGGYADDSVRETIDHLVAGQVDLPEVISRFRRRSWPAPRSDASDPASAWGVGDAIAADPNSWEAVESDSRLTVAQYATLAAAYRLAQETRKAA